ncbi:MAG: 3'-5' exonuclease [Candidatus Omnitrophota bacterium]
MEFKQQIESHDLAFLDLETTGLEPARGDAICEVGVVKIRNRTVVDTFHNLVNPKRDIPQEAYRIHGISNETVKDAPAFEYLAQNLLGFLDGCVIFAYNIEFDAGFLEYELKKVNHSLAQFPAIDILAMARKTVRLEKYNLAAVAASFNIPFPKAHRALDDAFMASEVFFKLADILKEKQLARLEDFLSLYGFSNDLFQTRKAIKVSSMQEAIDKQYFIKMRHFSSANIIEEQKIKPTRLVQENNHLYLLYQNYQQQSWRVNVNCILDVVVISAL